MFCFQVLYFDSVLDLFIHREHIQQLLTDMSVPGLESCRDGGLDLVRRGLPRAQSDDGHPHLAAASRQNHVHHFFRHVPRRRTQKK